MCGENHKVIGGGKHRLTGGAPMLACRLFATSFGRWPLRLAASETGLSRVQKLCSGAWVGVGRSNRARFLAV